jgi:hypothetical protein
MFSLCCCEGLKQMIACAGDQGVAVTAFHGRDCDYRTFRLQARAFEKEQEQRFQRMSRNTDGPLSDLFVSASGGLVPVVSVSSIPLLHCPYCGANLRRRIAWNRQEFDALAGSHRILAPE